jgi:hypothetical protein
MPNGRPTEQRLAEARQTPLSFELSVREAVDYALSVMRDSSVPNYRRDKMCQSLLTLPLPTIRYAGAKRNKQEAAESSPIY